MGQVYLGVCGAGWRGIVALDDALLSPENGGRNCRPGFMPSAPAGRLIPLLEAAGSRVVSVDDRPLPRHGSAAIAGTVRGLTTPLNDALPNYLRERVTS